MEPVLHHALLSTSFYQAYSKYTELESSLKDGSDVSFQDSLSQHIETLMYIWQQVQLLSIFSTNELLEDLPTSSLKFLLLPALLAESYWKSLGCSRENVLKQSKRYADKFISLTESYQIAIPHAFISANQSAAEEHRQLKIWKFKEQKRICHDIQWLLRRFERDRLVDEHGESEDDIDGYREAVLEWIQLFQFKMVDLLSNIQNELELLALKSKIESQKEVLPVPTLPHASQLSRPFTLLPSKALKTSPLSLSLSSFSPLPTSSTILERQRLQSAVFEPGYSLPTMTVDEWLDREMKMGNFLSTANEPPGEKSEDEDKNLDSESRLAKDRAWDTFKDENRRGWGNRMRQG